MARPLSFNKRENEKNKQKKRVDKQKRKDARKTNTKGTFEDMIAYVDENGVISSTPPDLTKKTVIDADSIEVSVPKKADIEEDSVSRGRVEHFNDSKGFGFIKDLASIEKYFFHISEVTGDIAEGNIVTFELMRGTRGMNAIKIKQFVEEKKEKVEKVEKVEKEEKSDNSETADK